MKKFLLAITIVLGGMLLMGCTDFVEANRKEIKESVKFFIEMNKLDPEKVEIGKIYPPKRYPNGDYEFMVDILYTGHPYFSILLEADPKSLRMKDHKDFFKVEVFNYLYIEERYEEFKPAIDYLESLGAEDTFRPKDSKVKYFFTSVGLDPELNEEIKQAYRESNKNLDQLKQYIKDHKEKITSLDSNTEIIAYLEDVDDEQAAIIKEELTKRLPKGTYVVEIGKDDVELGGINIGLGGQITIE
ncbi:hypothetical protein H1Z61_07305 [Bacillus aquiflavi]|uniref:Arm DNA-binding domain-containing protein n=1 Tax=Bacillus aquiflavi TaxID=2672567 RepID=A0A6B3W395_9BACI|nr:hypothetical protein [Bacillus aquiflavi]MBA4536955.1 hypothetical protein [Bacillus aquiflavi]NEY82341.1 hypothetical protein [Bacillus aquiflavi]UAC47770.1 hypothetical protein K6959_14260 [Bacillus aquiflavi]